LPELLKDPTSLKVRADADTSSADTHARTKVLGDVVGESILSVKDPNRKTRAAVRRAARLMR
jgi:hypothetical protein